MHAFWVILEFFDFLKPDFCKLIFGQDDINWGTKVADVAFQPYKNFMVLGFTIRVPKSAELSQYQIQSLRMKLLPTVSKFKLCRIPLKIDTIWMVENSRHTCTKYRFYYDQIFSKYFITFIVLIWNIKSEGETKNNWPVIKSKFCILHP